MPSPAPTPVESVRATPGLQVLVGVLGLLVLLAGCGAGGGMEPLAGESEIVGGPQGGIAAPTPLDAPTAAPIPVDVATVAPMPGDSVPGDLSEPGRRSARFHASGVLAAWDQARARAFAEGDPRALRALYVAGSAAGTSDLALLRGYRARGLRVDGMRMQLLSVRILRDTPRVLRLRVTDRLTGAVAVSHDARLRLPRDHASTRVVELRRSRAGDWRVAWVRE